MAESPSPGSVDELLPNGPVGLPIDAAGPPQASRLTDLSATQWKSGVAAWLGWCFDGLDMNLYTVVATPFVAELLGVVDKDPQVTYCGSWIQAAFLFGWAVGGSFFGRLGDRLGRSRALMLTILTYALFTGLSFFAQTWWQLLIFRFLAALGIGGEWAVGAALLAETWPQNWRPWLAAVLQTGVNVGTMMAGWVLILLAGFPHRAVFLAGLLPAFLVLWIRRHVPEPEEWRTAKAVAAGNEPRIRDLFSGPIRRTTLLTLLVCSLILTGHWAFVYWNMQYLRHLPDLANWSEAQRSQFVGSALTLIMVCSIVGNFLAAALALRLGYRRTIALMSLAYCVSMTIAYAVPRGHESLFWWLAPIGLSQGVVAPFSMYLPPLFPTLLRTTGAGFCFNFGRIVAGLGIILFALVSTIGDFRLALLLSGCLFVPAAAVAMLLPETSYEPASPSPSD